MQKRWWWFSTRVACSVVEFLEPLFVQLPQLNKPDGHQAWCMWILLFQQLKLSAFILGGFRDTVFLHKVCFTSPQTANWNCDREWVVVLRLDREKELRESQPGETKYQAGYYWTQHNTEYFLFDFILNTLLFQNFVPYCCSSKLLKKR